MATKKGSRIWWWIIPAVVILAGLGYYWYTRTGPETDKTLTAQNTASEQKPPVSRDARETGTRPEEKSRGGPERGKEGALQSAGTETAEPETFAIEKARTSRQDEVAAQGPIEELFVKAEQGAPDRKTGAEHKAYCALIDQHVRDFFESVNERPCFRQFNLNEDAHSYFAGIIKRLAARPPHPAGEGFEPNTLLTNIYFFSRALDRRDLSVIKAVIQSEGDALEYDMETFYRWLMLGDECPNPEGVRPPFEAIYRYAGFFLNTAGGRCYLFRRTMRVRLLVSYYCVLIIYQADRLGKNTYGLDAAPYLKALKKELTHHTELEFQDQYISTLERIHDYYLQKR